MNLTFPSFLKNLNPRIYESLNFRVLDFETTAEEKGSALCQSNRIITWAGLDGRTGKSCSGLFRTSRRENQRLLEYLADADFIVCQNGKFELQWLYRIGLEPGSLLLWDTMIADFCIAGNRKWELKLGTIAERYNLDHKQDWVHKLIEAGICPSQIPTRHLLESNSRDTKHTYEVFLKQKNKVSSLGLMPVVFTRCLTTLVLADIEKPGMCLDSKLVKEQAGSIITATRKVEGNLNDFTGGINPRSHKQVGKYLYDTLGFAELKDYNDQPIRTPAGARSTEGETILALRAVTERQQTFKSLFVEFSGLKKACETLEKMEECCAKDLGILAATLNQCIARNHRLTSTGKKYKIQLQNVDRDFKKLFKSRHEGWCLAAPDAPQLEFRVAGDLTEDPQVLKDVQDDFDPHLFTAHIIGKVAFDKIPDKLRNDLKPHTFKPVYFGSSGTPDQQRYYKAFKAKYRVMYNAQRDWCYRVAREKQLTIPSGLIFYWPDCRVHPVTTPGREPYIEHQSQIANYPISSFATADIMQIALVYVWYLMRGMKGFIVNTVHDAVPAEVPPDEVEEFWEICKGGFTTYVYEYLQRVFGYSWTVPLGVDAKIGMHWDVGKKYKYKNAATPILSG